MAKMTKTQKKNALNSISDKAFKLLGEDLISVNDYTSIRKVTIRGLNKLK